LEEVILSEPGFKGPTWEAREALLFLLKEKKLFDDEDERGDIEEEAEGAALHFMFLKKAIDDVLVSIFLVLIGGRHR